MLGCHLTAEDTREGEGEEGREMEEENLRGERGREGEGARGRSEQRRGRGLHIRVGNLPLSE